MKDRKDLIIGVLSGLLIAAVAALVVILATGDGDDEPSPAASPAPVETQSEEPEEVEPEPEPDGITSLTPVRYDGIGDIYVGMSVEEAEAATGETFEVSDQFPSEGCTHATILGGPGGLSFMVEQGVIVRVDVIDDPEISTEFGVGVGSTAQEVYDAYDGEDLSERPHPYDPDGTYIEASPPGNEDFLAVFETRADGSVSSYRTGFRKQAGYIEGCA